MLSLAAPTREIWTRSALGDLESVLLDHAHCEKKAAGAALKLLFAYPHHRFMQQPLAELAREELAHFERTLRLLDERGIRYRSQSPSPYGARLHAHVRHSEPDRCLDVLLIGALIEARSCERMRLLAEALAETAADVADFYRDLLASEARHHRLYLDLANELTDRQTAAQRLGELARTEAQILTEPAPFVRMHT
jgi:tRNA-(ms[2]io[6]A)-hydroxylase